jgi:catechol 2,3-dioxygenase-like lactoylglutathione lyase family enzyme
MLQHAAAMATLPAHNLQRALAFYHDMLGLEPEQQMQAGSVFRCGDTQFFLYETSNAGTARNTAMAFVVEDIAHEVAALRAKGVVFEEYDYPGLRTVNGIADLGGELSAWFHDSEGNILAISQWR